jgi:uncharacterized phage-associated protein
MSISVVDVARFFIQKMQDSGNMSITKLMKFLYYAQGIHLAVYDEALFSEELMAWQYGPVSPQVFNKFSKKGFEWFLDSDNAKQIDSEDVIKVLNAVWDSLGGLTAAVLVEMTHQEDPWQQTLQNQVITKDRLKGYFLQKANEGILNEQKTSC